MLPSSQTREWRALAFRQAEVHAVDQAAVVPQGSSTSGDSIPQPGAVEVHVDRRAGWD